MAMRRWQREMLQDEAARQARLPEGVIQAEARMLEEQRAADAKVIEEASAMTCPVCDGAMLDLVAVAGEGPKSLPPRPHRYICRNLRCAGRRTANGEADVTCSRCAAPITDFEDAIVSKATMDSPSVIEHGVCFTDRMQQMIRLAMRPGGMRALKDIGGLDS